MTPALGMPEVNDTQVSEEPVIELYPNPTVGISTVKWDLKQKDALTLMVTDVYGKIVQRNAVLQTEMGSVDVDIQHLSTGLYLVSGTSINKTIKLVKE